jgi:hypothetical protein
MNFYVARLLYKDGDWSNPCTVFANSYSEAVQRFETGDAAEIAEIIIRERPLSEAKDVYRHDPPTSSESTIMEHSDIKWGL